MYVLQNPKEVSDFLGLELQMVGRCHERCLEPNPGPLEEQPLL